MSAVKQKKWTLICRVTLCFAFQIALVHASPLTSHIAVADEKHSHDTHEATCQTLQAPADSFATTTSDSVSSLRMGAANSWRAIDTVIVLPTEFTTDPTTGLPLAITDEELASQVRLHVAQANLHLRDLRLFLRIVEIKSFRNAATDPFAQAASNRNAYDMLQTAVSISSELPSDRDFTLVLGRGYFRGVYGLAYASVSCQSSDYSVAFATQGGGASRLEHMLGHTIAHETGHFLGMSHDDASYSQGVPVMASRPATHEFGFSPSSIQQAENRIAIGLPGGSCFAQSAKPGIAGDSDFDSIPDEVELEAGSDPFDPGSYPSNLTSVVHAPWNSFLDALNIVELSNPGDDTTSIQFSLLAQNGVTLAELQFSLEPGAQRDVILDSLPGFSKNSYGLVRLSFTGTLEGRTAFYRSAGVNQFDFAYAIPLLNALTDVTTVSYNTFQPSLRAEEASFQVANWLTLVNLSDQLADFRVTSFDQLGNVVQIRDVRLASKARLDIDGGHGFAGAGRVGLHQIIPADPAIPYLSFLTRYGSNGMENRLVSKYFFAFPLLAHAGSRNLHTLELSSGVQQDNWLELSNPTGQRATAEVAFYSDAGDQINLIPVAIEALSQVHFNASLLLRDRGLQSGSAQVTVHSGRILSYSMHYFRNQSGSMEAMFGLPAQQALSSRISGSYNLFLSAENIVRLTNTSGAASEIVLQLSTERGVHEHRYSLAAHQTILLQAEELGALIDSYGVLQVESDSASTIVGCILRLSSNGSSFTLAIPTTLR